jgi:hypothetical protein
VTIALSEIRVLDEQRLLAAGSFGYPNGDMATQFVGIYRMRDGKIAHAQHSMSDLEMMSKLGLLD